MNLNSIIFFFSSSHSFFCSPVHSPRAQTPFHFLVFAFIPHCLLFPSIFIETPILFQLFMRKALKWLTVVRKAQLQVRSIALAGVLRWSIQLIPQQGLYNLSLALPHLCTITPAWSVLSEEAAQWHSCLSRWLGFPTTAGWGIRCF